MNTTHAKRQQARRYVAAAMKTTLAAQKEALSAPVSPRRLAQLVQSFEVATAALHAAGKTLHEAVREE
ncbi:MAG: hypothetical protein QM286_00740 [Acidobacteriota bacterium]|jgi:hypothetical protein|nr:hypothetical protein [Acidobacteriota bacterium]